MPPKKSGSSLIQNQVLYRAQIRRNSEAMCGFAIYSPLVNDLKQFALVFVSQNLEIAKYQLKFQETEQIYDGLTHSECCLHGSSQWSLGRGMT